MGKNEIYRWVNLVGPFLVHKLLGVPAPPPPPPLFQYIIALEPVLYSRTKKELEPPVTGRRSLFGTCLRQQENSESAVPRPPTTSVVCCGVDGPGPKRQAIPVQVQVLQTHHQPPLLPQLIRKWLPGTVPTTAIVCHSISTSLHQLETESIT